MFIVVSLGLAVRAQGEHQPDESSIQSPAPPSGGEGAGAGTALTEVAHERAEGGSDGDREEDACHESVPAILCFAWLGTLNTG
jgi:hypothetical protein